MRFYFEGRPHKRFPPHRQTRGLLALQLLVAPSGAELTLTGTVPKHFGTEALSSKSIVLNSATRSTFNVFASLQQSTHSAMKPMKIVATSQQSRFHTETLDIASGEIDLKDVTIAVGERELLTDTRLKLKEGIRYALVGRFVLVWYQHAQRR